jgi:hypothetical protein
MVSFEMLERKQCTPHLERSSSKNGQTPLNEGNKVEKAIKIK